MKQRPAKNDYQPWKDINKALHSDYARDTTCTVYTCIQAITITVMLKLNWNKTCKEYTTSIPSPRTPKDMFVVSVYEYAEKDKMEVLKKTAFTIDVAG